MPDVILYHMPPSFYSQIARIVLAEKGLSWHSKFIAAGPPIFESYEPWYMRLNPGGTVPTLMHGDHCVPDSFAIARYVEANFDGPLLIPAAPGDRAKMEDWIEKLGAISVRDISYGSDKVSWIGAIINRMRLRNLKQRERKHPEMAEVYRAKYRDIAEFAEKALDSAHVERIREGFRSVFDDMEGRLAESPWLCGSQYSLADAFWTVALARARFLKIEPYQGRPNLEAWYARVKARPSFETADVWEDFQISKLLPILLRKLGPRLAVILLVVGVLWAMLWWLI